MKSITIILVYVSQLKKKKKSLLFFFALTHTNYLSQRQQSFFLFFFHYAAPTFFFSLCSTSFFFSFVFYLLAHHTHAFYIEKHALTPLNQLGVGILVHYVQHFARNQDSLLFKPITNSLKSSDQMRLYSQKHTKYKLNMISYFNLIQESSSLDLLFFMGWTIVHLHPTTLIFLSFFSIFFFFLSEPHARRDTVWKGRRERPHSHFSIIV